MGGTVQNQVKKEQQLKFYGEVQDPYFGYAQVYISNKTPLCYIIKLTTTLDQSAIYNLFQKIQDNQSYSLTNLYGFQIKRKNYCDQIISESLTSYWSYSNFYLSEYLNHRRQRNSPFSENQMWHLIDVCCEASLQFSQYNIFYDFIPETMIVTLEGKVKLLWSHIRSQNSHLNYFRYFDSQYNNSYYSPQELEMMVVRQRSVKVNFKKSNTFSLGILLLYCASLLNPTRQLYILYSSTYRINKTKINYIKQKSLVNYSMTLQQLIKSMINWDHRQRPTLQQIKQQYSNHLKQYTELSLFKHKNKPNNKGKVNNQHFMSSTNTEDKTPQQFSRNSPFKHHL